MKAQHTPGPWIVIKPGEHGHTKHRVGHCVGETSNRKIYGAIADICITRIASFKGDISPTEEANARLIAAAPALLEICKTLLSGLSYGQESLRLKAESAIAQAEGGAQ